MRNIWATKRACVKRDAKMPLYFRNARTPAAKVTISLTF